VTPSRLQYLDLVWDFYYEMYRQRMPVDVWSTHIYLFGESGFPAEFGIDPTLAYSGYRGDLNECQQLDDVICIAEHDDPNAFEVQLRAMRQWMKDHGLQETPLIMSEWSILWPYVIDNPGTPQESCFMSDEFGNCFEPARVNAYMDATIDIMNKTDAEIGNPNDNNRLIQRYMWFSYYVDPEFGGGGGASSLLKPSYTSYSDGSQDALSEMGLSMKGIVESEPLVPNFHMTEDPVVVATTDSGTATVEIHARFTNNGNVSVQHPFGVAFYRDEALTDLIGTASVTTTVQGCGIYEYEATRTWANLPVGEHKYWAKIDPGGAIPETDKSFADNVAEGTVFIGTQTQFFPLLTTQP